MNRFKTTGKHNKSPESTGPPVNVEATDADGKTRQYTGRSDLSQALAPVASNVNGCNPDQSFELLDLPSELLVAILNVCDVKSIVRCIRVCRHFQNLIKFTTELQLRIELGLSGQEIVENLTSPGDLLHQLRAYNQAWRQLSYTEERILPKLNGGLWVLNGGIFAMTDRSQSITFHRLPSPLKRISYDKWTLGDFGVRFSDFGMDHSQDLLVLIEAPSNPVSLENIYGVHLRTLSSGEPHPSASAPILSFMQKAVNLVDWPYNIQISGSHIGVLTHVRREDRLYVWEWKTGKIEVILTGKAIDSFVFSSDRHIILALSEPAEMNGTKIDVALLIVDFINEPSESRKVWDVGHGCLLSLPSFHEKFTLLHRTNLRADPAPEWAPDVGSRAQFYPSKQNRTYVLSFEALSRNHPSSRHSYVLLIPQTTIQSCLENISPDGTTLLPWEKWGITGSCLIGPTMQPDLVWICYVNGSRYVTLEESPEQGVNLKVFDLNPHYNGPISSNHGSDNSPVTASDAGSIFNERVFTTYPYHIRTTILPKLEWDEELAVMCSEDCILIMDRPHQIIRVFAF